MLRLRTCCLLQVKIVKGQETVIGVDTPGFPLRRCYCSNCNARILHLRLDADGETVIRKVTC